jgi:CheY-like chemotaxis protein
MCNVDGFDTLVWPVPAEAGYGVIFGERRVEEVPLGSLAVLAVEETRAGQLVLEKLFARVGCPCKIAESAADAVVAFRDGRFDVVFVDAEANGIEAARAVRESGRVPIVGMLAFNEPEIVQDCRNAGIEFSLEKPVTAAKLKAAIYSALAGTAQPL